MAPAEEWTDHSEDDPALGPDFEPILQPQKKSRRGLWSVVGLIVLLGGGAGAAWHFYADSLFADPDAEIPFVRADTAPIKVRPESPGGLDVPDRDKLVYDRMEGNGERAVVERLLPTPEAPVPMPAPKPQVAQKPAVALAPAQSEPQPTLSAPEPPPPPAPDIPSKAPAATVEEVLTSMRPPPPPPEPKKAAETPKPVEKGPAAVQPPAKKTNGGFKVQLAAVREEANIEGEWKRLRGKHPDLLEPLSLSVMRADLGPAKGVFYRLRAGPLKDEGTARALCKKLADRKVGCLVIRPEG